MSVTAKVTAKEANIYTVEFWNDNDNIRIMKSPLKSSGNKAKVESEIHKQFKNFNGPLWGGMSIVWMIKV
ncbi:MAG: hypothetical protein [Caudoviricetes sp.]|nr:MAG: hypothetical protein [Caudoviricetes sp.]